MIPYNPSATSRITTQDYVHGKVEELTLPQCLLSGWNNSSYFLTEKVHDDNTFKRSLGYQHAPKHFLGHNHPTGSKS